MPKAVNYTNEEILLALIWVMPKKLTKGQIGRLLGIKSAGQKHWRERLEKLGEKNLLSIETLDAGELFFGAPILKYYITETNLEEIWSQYFVNYERNGLVEDSFLTPFSAGVWNVPNSPEFSKLVGSKFNYYFLCAKNNVNPLTALNSLKLASKEKIWKNLEAVLSIAWKTKTYIRKPKYMLGLTSDQKKAYNSVTSLYREQAKAHPAEYKKFKELFEKSFKGYL